MLDATSDFYASIAADQAAYQADVTSQDTTFQTTEYSDGDAFASAAQSVGEGLASDVAADDQSLQSTADSAANTLQTQDTTADQLALSLNAAADNQAQQTINQAKQDEANQDAVYESQLVSVETAAAAGQNSADTANDATYQNTMSTDEAQFSSNVSADQNSFDSTLAADDAQMQQSDASLQDGFNSQVASLAAARDAQIGGASPSVDPSVAESDPGYLAAVSAANDAWNTAQQNAQNDLTNGYATADADASALESAAASQLGTGMQNIQNDYNANVNNAINQFNQAIVPFQQQLSDTLAGDQDAYNSKAQAANDGYNADMQTAANHLASSQAGADAAYNSAAQPLVDGYNTWLAQRQTTYTGDINAREAQLAQDLAGEAQTYNTTAIGLGQTQAQKIQDANDQYASDLANLASIQSAEDAASGATCSTAVQAADSALASAEQTYNDAVSQIMQQAMDNNLPPDQGALDAAWNTLLVAKHAHANSVASAQAQFLNDQGDHLNEYVSNQKGKYVSFVDAKAAAEVDYQEGLAAAAQTRDDNDADHYASRDADEAEITGAMDDDVASHYEALQTALAALQKTREDAYADADKQYGDDQATAYQTGQGKIEDAAQQQQEDDAAAYETYGLQLDGPWAAEQNQIAQAEQQRAHDTGGVDATYSTAMAAAIAVDVSETEAAYDQAMTQLESGIEDFNDILAPAWAAAIIAASGNDPGTATWANAWAAFDEQEAADNAALLASEVGLQDGDVSQGLAAYNALVGQINGEDQAILDEWGAALVALVSGDVGAAVTANGQVLPAMLSAADSEIDDARTEAQKEINAQVADAQANDANDDQAYKAEDANFLTYAQSVLPAALSAFTAANDEAEGDVGTVAHDAAAYVKQMDGAAVAEIDALAPDGATMLHDEAVASGDYTIATTADQVTANNNSAAATVQWIGAQPDSAFGGEEPGSSYIAGAAGAPNDPGAVQPDNDLPPPQGLLASFFSDVSDFARWLTSPFVSPIPGMRPGGGGGPLPSPSGRDLANAALNVVFGPIFGGGLGMLNDAGYLPDTYMVGVQLDGFIALGATESADVAVHFTGANPLDWEFGLTRTLGGGVRFMGGVQESIVVSAVQNCNSLNELKGLSGNADIGPNIGIVGASVAVGNIGTELSDGGITFPIAPVDNIAGRRPTVYSVSAGPGFSLPNFVEPISGGFTVTYTQVETITPREWLTTMCSWENIENAWSLYWNGTWTE